MVAIDAKVGRVALKLQICPGVAIVGGDEGDGSWLAAGRLLAILAQLQVNLEDHISPHGGVNVVGVSKAFVGVEGGLYFGVGPDPLVEGDGGVAQGVTRLVGR